MTNRIIDFREKLIDISRRKTELLSSIIEHIDDVKSNAIFIEEVEGAYMELSDEELNFINEKEMTMACPGCGFECAGISSFCMACGENLNEQPFKEDM